MNNVLLSIIIPAYNCSAYITDTLQSILSQPTDNIYEIIVVNDGSTDTTKDLVQDLAAIHPCIHLFTIPNGGPANARNFGIQKATGTYITFVDSDDKMTENALSSIFQLLKQSDKDLYIWGFYIINEKTQDKSIYNHPVFTSTTKTDLSTHFTSLYERNQLNQIWNKAYKREFLLQHQLTFPAFKYGEDRLFIFAVLSHTNQITVTDQCYYEYYIRNNDSLVTKYCDNKFMVCCIIDDYLHSLIERLELYTKDMNEAFDYMFLKSCISCLSNLFSASSPLNRLQKRQEIAQIINHKKVKQALLTPVTTGGFAYKIIHLCLKTKNITLIYILSFFIVKVSILAPKLFMKTKHYHNTTED